jgi:broad specificity phosphatase PhoE
MSKTYYLFRHGETFATLKNKGYGWRIRSAHTLEAGKPVTKEIAQFLKDIKSDHNATSGYTRCLETAQIITDVTGKQFVVDRRLNEFFFETFGNLRNRLKNFLAEMEDSDYETILVCTHGACLAGLIMLLTTGQYHAADLISYPPPGILIKIENCKVEEWDFNEK